MVNVINLPTHEQSEDIKTSLLELESTAGQVLDIDNKKYKAVFEDSFAIVEKISNAPIFTNNVKLKDCILSFQSGNVLRIIDLNFNELISLQAPSGALYLLNDFNSMKSPAVTEDNTHIYILMTASGSDYRYVDVIEKGTWKRTSPIGKVLMGTSKIVLHSIAADPENNKLYLILHANSSVFQTYALSDLRDAKINSIANVSSSTVYAYEPGGNAAFVYCNGLYVPQNHAYFYMVASRNGTFERNVLKIRKSDLAVVAKSPSMIQPNPADSVLSFEFDDNYILFNSNSSSKRAFVLDRDTMGIREYTLPLISVFNKEGDDIYFYTPMSSTGQYTIESGKMLPLEQSLTPLVSKVYNIDNWENIDSTNTTITITILNNEYYLHIGAKGVHRLESVKKILGYKEVTE